MQVAKYFASLGVDVDKSSFSKADKAILGLEKKLKKLGSFGKGLSFNVASFSVDQRKLNTVLGNALDVASKQVKFEVSQFIVNDRSLQAALQRSARRIGSVNGSGTGANTGHMGAMSAAEWDRRQSVLGRAAIDRHQRQLELANMRSSGAKRGSLAIGASVGKGGLGFSNFVGPALALGVGGYGLSQLNQRNQQVVSAQLQSQAVVQQAGGTAGQGQDSFQYLRKEGNRIGFNYLEASGDYNKLISGLTGSGVGLKESQKVFSGFAELARVNKLDKTTQNRLFRALSQVAGKGKLMSEELTGQIAEALPGGTPLFAEAYQAQLRSKGQGGDKTGAEAIQQLLADMKKGKVTSDILTFAGARASTQANAGGALTAASTASQAEQARYQNVVSDMSVLASNNGVEEGFARIFRTLSAGLSESNSLVKTLAESFNQATIDASKLLLFPQSFMRALDGRDSLVADWLGADKTAQLIDDYSQIKVLFDDIAKSIGGAEWSPTLKATAEEIAGIMRGIASLQIWAQRTSDTGNQIYQDQIDEGASPLKATLKSNWFTFKSTIMPWNANEYAAEYGAQRMADMGESIDPVMGPNGLDVDAYWNHINSQAKDYSTKQFGPQGYNASQSSANAFQSSVDTYKQGISQAAVNQNKFDVNVVLQSGDRDEISKYFRIDFQNDIDTAMLHFEQK
jgi:hypothetical protein